MIRVLLLAVLFAAPAQALRHRAHKAVRPPPARAEDDPRKKGDNQAFAKAAVSFSAPEDQAVLDPAPLVHVELKVTGYGLGPLQKGGPSPHLHLIVDNEPALEIADLSAPLRLSGLPAGPHLLRAVLCRPWHEVVKAPRAFAMVRFWLGRSSREKRARRRSTSPGPIEEADPHLRAADRRARQRRAPFRVTREVQQQADGAQPESGTPLPPRPRERTGRCSTSISRMRGSRAAATSCASCSTGASSL